MSGSSHDSVQDAPLAALRGQVERLWRQLADATAAATRAGLLPSGTQPRIDLDTAQSALAHALRELRVGEGRSAVDRNADPESAPESAPQPQHNDPRSARWGDRLRAVGRQLVGLRQALANSGEIDALSAEWAPLMVAAGLVELAADSLDALPADAAAPAGAAGDAAFGPIPDAAGAEDDSNATHERERLVAELRPRLHAAAADALAELSLHELHALAAHPDTTAALVLLVGLAMRAGAHDPAVTQDEAANLLADLGVTPEVVRRLIIEGSLPARLRRSDLLAVPVGELLAACRAVESTAGVGVRNEPKS